MLTKNAIRPGCGRGPLAYDYVNLGLEEVSHKVRLILVLRIGLIAKPTLNPR